MEIIRASIVFDSYRHAADPGFRGKSDTHQVVLRARDVDIHIQLREAQGKLALLGQLLTQGPDEWAAQAAVHLISDGQRVDSATPDEFGEFRFDGVPDKPLSLQVDLPTLTLIGALRAQTESMQKE